MPPSPCSRLVRGCAKAISFKTPWGETTEFAIFTRSTRESAFILRITRPRCAFTVLSRILKAHTRIRIDLFITNLFLDLVAENLDVAIRFGEQFPVTTSIPSVPLPTAVTGSDSCRPLWIRGMKGRLTVERGSTNVPFPSLLAKPDAAPWVILSLAHGA
jgi:hypothetical protein